MACIGPAGEAMLHGASVKNDRNHGAHKGSVGAVMGSKNLKAIAVRGTNKVPLADPIAFVDTSQTWDTAIHADRQPGEGSPSVGGLLANAGIVKAYTYVGESHMLAGKNLTDPLWGENFLKSLLRNQKIGPSRQKNLTIAALLVLMTAASILANMLALPPACAAGEKTLRGRLA